MSDLSSRAHVILLLDGDEAVVLLRDVRGGSVRYHAPGVALAPDETPGRGASRAAEEQLGIHVAVGQLVYADTEMGVEHYFFLGTAPDGGVDPARLAFSGSGAVVLLRAALLAYPVEPSPLARRLFRLQPHEEG